MARTKVEPQGYPGTLLRTVVVLVLALFALTGCSSIPLSGPVGTSQAEQEETAPTYTFNPPGPAPDADPKAIVEGFLLAVTATQDDYGIAREFLAPSLAGEWQPVERTVVYRNAPNIVGSPSETEFVLQLEVAAVIDESGIRQESEAGATESIPVVLSEVDGQWRISEIPDGTMISTVDFPTVFTSHNLYFYDATYTYAVPDVRWFASRQGLSAAIVAALLEGPAPFLNGAVISAFPEGSTLVRRAVPVESGAATVDLSADVLTGTTFLRRQQMQQQLELTLGELNTVSTVKMTVDQREVDLGPTPDPGFQPAVVGPAVGSTQIAILDDELVFYEGSRPVEPEGLPSVAEFSPRDPAMSLDQEQFAFLSGQRNRLFVIGEDRQVQQAATGTGLTPPSIDPFGWTWTAAGDQSGQVFAVAPDENATRISISAQWLSERTVTELRISREGARALIIARSGDTSRVYLAGVVRDQNGQPRSINTPVALQPSVPVDSGVWAGETTVIVMEASDEAAVTAEILNLNGASQRMAPLDGMLEISAGNGSQDVYAQTPRTLYIRVGNSWAPQSRPLVLDPSFPG
ncbi:lipoprotein LpqB [Arthrobacter crystallopoietes BAB-32]|uniref:Lipoprotein LpqB n=1 Tax=Arthrobacter crystallopoietes BAB-32 TaxID=1246476 RepID=N1V458_9MICC|nr:LpqB family beta-propeller domain-containing protein [Arthrobacter crystallopoietes]EMY33043.1 lipoprotein LpqB [Arthrobacter crystallopoietes BAB-32]